MSATATSELQSTAHRPATDPAAVRWIARQLEWERTLDQLRGGPPLHSERRAA